MQKQLFFFLAGFLMFNIPLQADLPYLPVQFKLSTDKESYYEGEKITFFVTITNTDKENSYPVLLPHTQNTGQKLFFLSAYDKARQNTVLRYREDKMLNMMVHDTGSVKIHFLKPLEQIVIPIYLNDFENYFSYHTQNASHHSFGVPLFAGIYRVNLTYHPFGQPLGDSIYAYFNDMDEDHAIHGKLAMPQNGMPSNITELRIKRSRDTLVSIERKNYYIKTDGHRFFYLSENLPQITTDLRCHHITNIAPDSCSAINEYFYSHFTDLYAEYIARFEDGEIREYRKFLDVCPDYLYTLKFNAQREKTYFAEQLPDKRFYSISYHQPGNRVHEESYCSANGTLCAVTTYQYDKHGELIRKKISYTEPCIEIQLEDGTKRSYLKVEELGGG